MFRIIVIVAVAGLLLCINDAHAGPDVKEGKWEITVKMDMPGMPMEMPPATFTQCLSDQDNIPVNKQEMQNCTLVDSSVSGNTATWVMKCDQAGEQLTSRGSITYSDDTFSGESQIQMQGMDITQKMRGRRVGDCD